MADKLRLETNKPQIIALKYTAGKEVPGNFGDQMLFTLTDGRIWYAPLFVAEKVDALQLGRNEPFQVCKTEVFRQGQKPLTVYEIERAETALTTQPPAPQRKPAPTAATGDQVTTQQNQGTSPALRAFSPAAKTYMLAFADALDIAHEVAPYAKKRGIELEFSCESIRAMATTLFIHAPKGTC